MSLILKKPLAFLDLETTGINLTADRIVEIAILKVMPDTTEEWFHSLVNPEMPIPPKSTSIHGISDKDVAASPKFNDLARRIASFLEGCDLGGYNAIKFDFPVLMEEFKRAGVEFNLRKPKFIDPQVIFHRKEQRTLTAAYKFYCGKELTDAHTAKSDTLATYEILKAQIEMYPDIGNDVEALSAFSTHNKNADLAGRIIFDDNGVEIFNFGKHKGKSVTAVFDNEPGYFSWMMNGDFPQDTKDVLTKIRLKPLESKNSKG